MFRSKLFRRALLTILIMVVLHTVSLWGLTVPYIRRQSVTRQTAAARTQLNFAYDFLQAEHEALCEDTGTPKTEAEARRHEAMLIESLRMLLLTKRIVRRGYFFVFDGSGRMLIHPHPRLDGADVSDLKNPATGHPLVEELMAAAHTPSHRLDYVWSRPDDPERYVYKKIAWVRHFKPHDLHVTASVYVSDLHAPGDAILARILGASLLMLVLYTVVVIPLVRAHLRPLGELADTAERVAGGDLSARCSVRRNDEVGRLARVFNRMVDQVRANIHQLDAKVNERTRELAAANEDLTASVERLKTTQGQLVDSERRAQEASQAKSAFVAAMSHEFRTPLNAIIGYSEMLEEECEDSGYEELCEDLIKIQTAGRQLLELVDDVLDLSKVEAGRMEFVIEAFRISDLVDHCRGSVEPQAEANGNQLVIRCPPDAGEMVSDRVRVRQILINLLSNACKFTENGTVTLSVSRGRENGVETVAFRVTDTGIGMSAEQLRNLFQAFRQGDVSVSRSYGGTGLGLSLSRTLCRQLGGDIAATSTPGEGSTFVARLPAAAPQASESATRAPSQAPSAMPTVLVIEDDPDVRRMLGRFFQNVPVQLLTAADGQEGLRLAEERRPDVITLDVVMPRMDGWAVLRALRADPALAETPVVLVTVDPNRDRGYALGATEYITKPLDPRQLVDTVLRHIDSKRTET